MRQRAGQRWGWPQNGHNLNIYKPKHDRWLARHAFRDASFTLPKLVREAIDRFVQAYNPNATPFVWIKRVIRAQAR